MVGFALGLVAGTIAAAWLAPAAALVLGLGTILAGRGQPLLLPALLGATLGALRFDAATSAYRALATEARGIHVVRGDVRDLPARGTHGTRFYLAVAGGPLRGARLRLTWRDTALPLRAGDEVRLTARLRMPRGLANPGGFDGEAWAFAAGVHATGYVREGQVLGPGGRFRNSLDRLRSACSDALRQVVPDSVAARLLPALAVADRRGIDDQDREILRVTGTMHLLAISGLHVGLVALGGLALGSLLWPLCGMPASRRGFALIAACVAAAGYAALAGFGLSTLRALLMLLGVAFAWWSRGRISTARGLLLAAALMLLVDPRAVAAAGFWLSFGAVACLLAVSAGWRGLRRGTLVLRAQAAIFLGLRPVAAAHGMPSGWLAPVLNLVAIPWVGWLVVPALLAGIVIMPGARAGEGLVLFAGHAVERLYLGLAWASEAPIPGPAQAIAVGSGGAVGTAPRMLAGWLMLAGAILLALPGGLRVRGAGVAVLLATLWRPAPRVEPGGVDLHVLDVGQGLAVVIESAGRRLLYDAGPASPGGWSAGADIVVPFLAARDGGARVDRVILSHGDLDHAGGWPDVRAALDPAVVAWAPTAELGRPCRTGMSWRWGDAEFRIVHPDPGLPDLGNDSSCVLLVEVAGRRILIPGDVSAMVEPRLARRVGPLAVLVAAHHGSAGSSSAPFVAATRPEVVVFSHGHGNRFDMPRPVVFSRFADARRLGTAACGQLHLRVDGAGVRLLAAERNRRRRPWHGRQDDGLENQYDCATLRTGASAGPRGG